MPCFSFYDTLLPVNVKHICFISVTPLRVVSHPWNVFVFAVRQCFSENTWASQTRDYSLREVISPDLWLTKINMEIQLTKKPATLTLQYKVGNDGLWCQLPEAADAWFICRRTTSVEMLMSSLTLIITVAYISVNILMFSVRLLTRYIRCCCVIYILFSVCILHKYWKKSLLWYLCADVM